MTREVAICHFNTPELTEAAILSLRKHGGESYHVTVFDNSTATDFCGIHREARPFTAKMNGVTVIDNTQGQIIDFAAELAKFPDREPESAASNDWGSVKHMITIQYLFDLLPDGFLLMDSDILIKQNVDHLFMPERVAVGHVQEPQPGNRYGIGRLVPMLCYINVPMCRQLGIRYYDPERCWMLYKGMADRRNWYDTGASFMEDIRRRLPRGERGWRVDIRPLMEHYKCGSWQRGELQHQLAWLNAHRELWEPTPRMRGEKRVAICAVGRNEDLYAREWVEHYKKLGVSKIFVYDNWFDGETKLADTLSDYVADGFVEIYDLHNKRDKQIACYTHCYQRHGNEYAWIGFLDFDEYLRWDSRKKIESMFAHYDDADCVLVNWRLMTDNGLTTYDHRPLAVRFTEPMDLSRHVKYDFPENEHVKCFVRGGIPNLVFTHLHYPGRKDLVCVNPKGNRVPPSPFVRPFDHSVMRIDHYWTKTAEEWRNIKLKRGFATGREYDKWFMQQQENFFFRVNERTPEKEAILRGKPLPQKQP